MGAVKNGRELSGHQVLKLAESQEGLDWSKLIFISLYYFFISLSKSRVASVVFGKEFSKIDMAT